MTTLYPQDIMNDLWGKMSDSAHKDGNPAEIYPNIQFMHQYANNSTIIDLPPKPDDRFEYKVIETIEVTKRQTILIGSKLQQNSINDSSNISISSSSDPSRALSLEKVDFIHQTDPLISSSSNNNNKKRKLSISSIASNMSDEQIRKKRKISNISELGCDSAQNSNNLLNDDNNIDFDIDANNNQLFNDNQASHIEAEQNDNLQEIEVVAVYVVAIAPNVEDEQYTKKVVERDFIGNSAIRIPYEIVDKTQTDGALSLIKMGDKGTHDAASIIKPCPLPNIQPWINKPDKIVTELSSAIAKTCGLAANFTPKVGGRNSETKAGYIYITRFILPQFANTRATVKICTNYGLVAIGNRKYIAMRRNQVLDMKDKTLVCPLSHGIYIDHAKREADTEADDIDYNYPQIVDGQTDEPLSEEDCKLLEDTFGKVNIILNGMFISMDCISFNAPKIYVTYGGTQFKVIVNGIPKSGKSTLLSLHQSGYGINEFHIDPSQRGVSTLKMDDYTIAAIRKQSAKFIGFAQFLEDIDRVGNKKNTGGVEGLLWGTCGLSKSSTASGGDVAACNCPHILTNNTPLQLFKDDGTRSRAFLWLFSSIECLKGMTEAEKSQRIQQIAAIVPKLSQRAIYFLTSCMPSQQRISAAARIIDKISKYIQTHHAHLTIYIDTRELSQLIPIIASMTKVKRIFRISSSDIASTMKDQLVLGYQYVKEIKTGTAVYCLNPKYKYQPVSKINKYLLNALKIINSPLVIVPANLDQDASENEEKAIINDDTIETKLEELKSLQFAIQQKQLISVQHRKNKDDAKRTLAKVICINTDNKNDNAFLKIFQFMDAVVILNEQVTLNLNVSNLSECKFLIVDEIDWKNVVAIMKYRQHYFTNRAGYSTIRVNIDSTSKEHTAFLIDPSNEKYFDDLMAISSSSKKKNKEKTNKSKQSIEGNKEKDTEKDHDKRDDNKDDNEHVIFEVPDLQQIALSIINDIMNDQRSQMFNDAVDTDEFSDYLDKIHMPMDFGTILQNVNDGKYDDIFAFGDDCRLVLSNAMNYNLSQSEIYQNAALLQTKLNQLLVPATYHYSMNSSKVTSKISFPKHHGCQR